MTNLNEHFDNEEDSGGISLVTILCLTAAVFSVIFSINVLTSEGSSPSCISVTDIMAGLAAFFAILLGAIALVINTARYEKVLVSVAMIAVISAILIKYLMAAN